MTLDWQALDTELALWRDAGLTLPLWWRDDDAVQDTAALDRLGALSSRHGLPVHLAIIPAGAQPGLAAPLRAHRMTPLVHGWAHANHAPAGEKKSEFRPHRPLTERIAEARRGMARLTELLDMAPAPLFVPPWNRIGADMAAALPEAGFAALSTFGPRSAPEVAPGVLAVNTHLDPIDWHGTRSLRPSADLLAQFVADLGARRAGRHDNGEPYGLLTHHLVHDEAIWGFVDALLTRLMAGPVTPWSALTLEDTPR
mgnify:CR=1 FL=1